MQSNLLIKKNNSIYFFIDNNQAVRLLLFNNEQLSSKKGDRKMKKFSKEFKVDETAVQFFGTDSKWYKVKEIHETRKWIKVDGLEDSFQRDHILSYSNKETVEELNELELYRVEYGKLYKLDDDERSYIFVHKNAKVGNTKKALLRDYKRSINCFSA